MGIAIVAALGMLISCVASGPADMEPGERLFKSKCGACHLRPHSGRFTRSGWEQLLIEHDRRVPLSQQERDEMLNYLGGSDDF